MLFEVLLSKINTMQKYSFFFVLSLLCSCSNLFGQMSIQKLADAFEQAPANKYASISLLVVDLDSDSVIANVNADKILMCASTAKLFSTFSALEILGADYRPSTSLYTDGYIDSNGTLQGNLIVRGGGDITLGSKYFHEEAAQFDFLNLWKDTLQNLGIRSIRFSVIADGSRFGYAGVPDGWDWSDMGNYYGAGASGINFYDNTVKYHFQTFSTGRKAKLLRTFPLDENLKFRHTIESAAIRKDQSYLFGAPYSQDRFGIGSLPSNRKDFTVKGSMHDPEFMLAKEMSTFFTDSNIQVSGIPYGFRLLGLDPIPYDSLTLLYTHKGQRLKDIIDATNLNSVNLFAEGLLNLIGFEKNGFGSTSSGIKGVYANLKNKVNLEGMKLKDGSGLSRKNAVSAQNFCNLLGYIYKSKLYDEFKSSLAIAGETGTLKNICRSQAASGKMFAKSGTLSNVKAYSGYVKSGSGKNLAFSIIVNNFNCPRYQIVKKMEVIFNAMASY